MTSVHSTSTQLAVLAIFGALVVVAKATLNLPIKVPGHSGLVWMALLVAAGELVPRRGAAALVGLLSGLIALAAGVGEHGVLATLTSYAAAGAGVDIGLSLARSLAPLAAAAIAGLLGNLAKLLTRALLDQWLGVAAGFAALGRFWPLITTVLFGLAGGLLGHLAIHILSRAGVVSAPGRRA